MARVGITKEELMGEFQKRTRLLYELYKRKIFDYDTVQKIINEYYKDSETVMKRYGLK
jgi:hypothetical protein